MAYEICYYKGYAITPDVCSKDPRDHYATFILNQNGKEKSYVVRPNFKDIKKAYEASYKAGRQLVDRLVEEQQTETFDVQCHRAKTVFNDLRRRLYDRSKNNIGLRAAAAVYL